MTKRRIIFVLLVCSSIAVFTVQTLSQARSSDPGGKSTDPERLRNMTGEERKRENEKRLAQRRLELERLGNMTGEERKRELAKWKRENEKRLAQQKLERENRPKESAKERAERLARFKSEREQKGKELQKISTERRKTFFYEKHALSPTEEQWKLIKPKLEKLRRFPGLLRRSEVWLGLTNPGKGKSRWRLNKGWRDKKSTELNEVQKISDELMDLLEREDTTAEEFEQKMDALRRSRLKDIEELERQLSEVRQELRELLTPRQKAAELLFVDRLLWKYLLLRYNGCMHHAN